nr:hypothetical protein CFP56_52165 [Quercus suber]
MSATFGNAKSERDLNDHLRSKAKQLRHKVVLILNDTPSITELTDWLQGDYLGRIATTEGAIWDSDNV